MSGEPGANANVTDQDHRARDRAPSTNQAEPLLIQAVIIQALNWMTVLVAFAALLFGTPLVLAHIKDVGIEILLPLLAIGGVLVLFAALSLISVVFKSLDLADPHQAFGLPDGSIRAVIALSLVVIFAILSVFLYSNMSQGNPRELQNLTAAQRDQFLKDTPSNQIVAITCIDNPPALCPHTSPANTNTSTTQQSPSSGETTPGTPNATSGQDTGAGTATVAPSSAQSTTAETTPAAESPQLLYTITVRTNDQASNDFAKQLLVLVGTLMASVTSFYLGSKASKTGKETPPTTEAKTPPDKSNTKSAV